MSTNDCATHRNIVPILDNTIPVNGADEYITRQQAITYGANFEYLSKYKSDKELVMLNDIIANNGILFNYNVNSNDLISNVVDYDINYNRNKIEKIPNGIFFNDPYSILEITADRYISFDDSQAFSVVTGIAFTEGNSSGLVFTLEGNFNDNGYYDKLVVRKNKKSVDFALYNSGTSAIKSIYSAVIPAYGALVPFGVGFENSALYLRFGGSTFEHWLTNSSGVVFMMIFGSTGEPSSNFMILDDIIGYDKQIV